MLVYQNKSLIIIIALKSFCHLKTLEKHFEKFIFIPCHFKKCGVLCYTLHSKNYVRVSVRLYVRAYVCPSVSALFSLAAGSIF